MPGFEQHAQYHRGPARTPTAERPPGDLFAIRHARRPRVQAWAGMRGSWDGSELRFRCRWMEQRATRTEETVRVVLNGAACEIPVYVSETKVRTPVPHPGSSKQRPHEATERVLIFRAIQEALREGPVSTTVLRPRLNRRTTPGTVPENAKESILGAHLHTMQRMGYVKKRTGKWHLVKDVACDVRPDDYIAYRAMRDHITMLQAWGMRTSRRVDSSPGLADALFDVLDKIDPALELWRAQLDWRRARGDPGLDRDRYCYEVALLVVRWIRAAPWLDGADDIPDPPGGTEAIFVNSRPAAGHADDPGYLEIWDGATKWGDIPQPPRFVDAEAVRFAEDFLRAHVRYPYERRILLGPPVRRFKAIGGLERYGEGCLVHDGRELRRIVTMRGSKLQLAPLQDKRRTLQRLYALGEVRCAWRYRMEEKKPINEAVPVGVGDYRVVICQWSQEWTGEKLEYILDMRLVY